MKANDVSLFICIFEKEIIPMFFTAGPPSFSKWMSMYTLNVLNIADTYHGLQQVVDKGGL